MILADNINILKEAYPNIWNRLQSLEKTMDTQLVGVEDTRKSDKTLFVEKDGKKVYLHSKYDPLREAEAIVAEYKEIEDGTTVIFYGIGLGYHIDLFLKKYPNVNYYIYEPIPEIANVYLSHKSIKKLSSLKLKDIVLGDNEFDIKNFLSKFIDKSSKNILYICLNSHMNIFPDEYRNFIELFKETMKDKKNSLGINLAFQKRWIVNSMKNFGEVLSTPNIIIEKKGEFKNKPAILVAAGPSLNEEIENLRYIKENGLAYIFSVGSAINTLIHNDIYPDAATTYDPGAFNQNVFKSTKEKEIKEIPMIFGSTVGYETIENYPGERYHMITSQDTVSNYYLKNEDDKDINMIQDAPTIAVVTLQLVYELGFSHIILVGQNLAYKGRAQHSEGISYSIDLNEEQIEKGIKVKDVCGNEILTNEGFNTMRQQMEQYIKQFPNIKVTNTTKDGADIKGTNFIELREVINGDLKEKIVQENWIYGNKTSYNQEYLKIKLKDMDRAYDRALKTNKEYSSTLDRIDKLINTRSLVQVEKMYIKLDKVLRKLENNDYYKTFILPMNRVQYKILADSIDSLNDERNPYEKGKKIVGSFRNFMEICTKDMEMIDHIYEEMKESISKICNIDSGVW